jgi:hypothetical protein
MDFDPFDPSGQDSPQGWLYRNIIDRLQEIAADEGLDTGYSRQYALEAREIVNIGLGVYHRIDVKVLFELPETPGEEASRGGEKPEETERQRA